MAINERLELTATLQDADGALSKHVVRTISLSQLMAIPGVDSGIAIAGMSNVQWWLQDAGLIVNDATRQAEEWSPSRIVAGGSEFHYKLTQHTVSWQPLRVDGDLGINGKAALQFDGLQDYMEDDDHAAMALGAATEIQVLDTSLITPVVDDGGAQSVDPRVRQRLTKGAGIIGFATGSTSFSILGDQVLFSFGAWQLGIDSEGRMWSEGVGGNRATGDSVLSPNATYVVRVEHDDTNLSMWINSVVQTLDGPDPGWPGDLSPVTNSVLGARVSGGTVDRFFEGKILIGGSGIVWLNTVADADRVERQLKEETGVS